MQRQAILYSQPDISGIGLGAGLNFRINLSVLVGVGPIQLRLEYRSPEDHIRVQARQHSYHIVRAEIPVADHSYVRKAPLEYLQLHHFIGNLLLGNRYADGW